MSISDFEISKLSPPELLNELNQKTGKLGYDMLMRLSIQAGFLESFGSCLLLAKKYRIPLNYICQNIQEVFKPEPKKNLPFPLDPQEVLKMITPFNLPRASKYPEIMRNTAFVNTYGRVQFEGTRDKNAIVNCLLPGIGTCLGIIIKDLGGNITAQHLGVDEQYNPDSVIEAMSLHQSSFGATKSTLLCLAGFGLRTEGFGDIVDTSHYPRLKTIDTERLKPLVRANFLNTNLSFGFLRGAQEGGSSTMPKLRITDLLTNTYMSSPIAHSQYTTDFSQPLAF